MTIKRKPPRTDHLEKAYGITPKEARLILYRTHKFKETPFKALRELQAQGRIEIK